MADGMLCLQREQQRLPRGGVGPWPKGPRRLPRAAKPQPRREADITTDWWPLAAPRGPGPAVAPAGPCMRAWLLLRR